MIGTDQIGDNLHLPTLRAKRLGLHTQHQAVVVMRTDCHVCRSEGLSSRAQVLVTAGARQVQANLFQIDGDMIAPDQVALSETAWALLGVSEGDLVGVSHPPTLDSLASVRRRIYGNRLERPAFSAILRDVVAGRYTDVQLAAFLTAGAALPLDEQETVDLTHAMVEVGDRLRWGAKMVVDKHCIGGLPGNRTTPIVVAIAAANGLIMPKTSSRAITSPAGTVDTMETLAPVALDIATMRRVVDREGGCIVWGGAMRLSPADDILIRVERPLDLDSEGQMVASILSKKAAAGSTHVVIDMPVGATAKVRDGEAARSLSALLVAVGKAVGLEVRIVVTDGAQPVGRRIGPALEARDVLAVLQGAPGAPLDLRDRAARLAGEILELANKAAAGAGMELARVILDDGRAWRKFQAICEAQGGMRVPPRAAYTETVTATRAGKVTLIDNRRLARIAKLAGAPTSPAAGLELHTPVGTTVERDQPLFTVHAEAPGELAYALDYVVAKPEIVRVGGST